MAKAIYPGSFDPITFGHISVIERAAGTFDELIVAVLKNSTKKPLFDTDERVEMIKSVTGHLGNVKVMSFDGLTVEFAKANDVKTIIRGLRAVTDFEYELQMAQSNKILAPDIETVFFTTDLEYAYLSSSTVREIAKFGGDIRKFVPEGIVEKIYKKYE